MGTAIRVDNLSKSYKLGQQRGPVYRTLRESITESAAGAWRGLRRVGTRCFANRAPEAVEPPGAFWALKDVSFEVQPGEVVGIIGRNGAGKSTLLKILSRITEPTSERAEVRGRMGSLLEVGTGFHPELTGRENIYLNGSILGMTRREITRQFDAIVAFSEIEKFLDTPVKRYSSGMYVRLAFAVAAHLEPEILVVDEVLAVGDQQFQTKCIKQMQGVAKRGRTVIVVSHNLSTVQALCSRVIQLHAGGLIGDGNPKDQIGKYLQRLASSSLQNLESRTDREGNGKIRVTAVSVLDEFGNNAVHIHAGDPIEIRIGYRSHCPGDWPMAAISVWSLDGAKVFHVDNVMRGMQLPLVEKVGTFTCRFPRLILMPGRYYVNVAVRMNDELGDHIYWATDFEVLEGDYYKIGQLARGSGGMVMVDHDWR